MDPQSPFCSNLDCPKRGRVREGNIGVHSRKEERYIGPHCGQTFAATTGTLFYRRRYEASFISQELSLLAHGCPPQAIVTTFEVDERTLADWQQAAGTHRQQVYIANGHRLSFFWSAEVSASAPRQRPRHSQRVGAK